MSTFSTCTSSTRPASPANGDVLFETDTKNVILWDGTNWRGYNNDGAFLPTVSNSFSGSFNGSSDYLDVGQISTLAGATQQTTAFWFKSTSAGEFPDWGFRVDSFNSFGAIGNSGNYYFSPRNGSTTVDEFSVEVLGADMPNDTNWHHFVHTFNAGTCAVYIDGIEKGTPRAGKTPPTTLNGTIGDFYIGKNGNISFYAAGSFDEFAMWDVALDASNAAQLYNSGRPIALNSDAGNYNKSADLTHWWRIGDDASDTGTGGVADGNAIINVENAANNNTNDASVGGGSPTYSSSTP
jgi:hypothetical protein